MHLIPTPAIKILLKMSSGKPTIVFWGLIQTNPFWWFALKQQKKKTAHPLVFLDSVFSFFNPGSSCQFFTGESLCPDGMVAVLDYREDNVTPFMRFFKDGLKPEKCVSTQGQMLNVLLRQMLHTISKSLIVVLAVTTWTNLFINWLLLLLPKRTESIMHHLLYLHHGPVNNSFNFFPMPNRFEFFCQ